MPPFSGHCYAQNILSIFASLWIFLPKFVVVASFLVHEFCCLYIFRFLPSSVCLRNILFFLSDGWWTTWWGCSSQQQLRPETQICQLEIQCAESFFHLLNLCVATPARKMFYLTDYFISWKIFLSCKVSNKDFGADKLRVMCTSADTKCMLVFFF